MQIKTSMRYQKKKKEIFFKELKVVCRIEVIFMFFDS